VGGVLGPWRFERSRYGAAKGLTPGWPFEPAQPACLRQAGSQDELKPCRDEVQWFACTIRIIPGGSLCRASLPSCHRQDLRIKRRWCCVGNG
jgi:hypothetical protein